MQDMLFWSFPALWLKTSVDSHLTLLCMAMAAAVDWLKMGASRVGEVEVEVVVVVVVVVMLIVIVDVDVYMTFQQSHVIKHDPKKKIHNFFTYHSIKYFIYKDII